MICPRCDRETVVKRTDRHSRGRVWRERACECGITFATEEKYKRKWVRATVGVYRRPVTDEQRLAVFARDGGKCHYCGTTDRLGIDHVVPISTPLLPGEDREAVTEFRNSIENMVCCCLPCNMSKGPRLEMGGPKVTTIARYLTQETLEKGEEIESGSVSPGSTPDLLGKGDQEEPRARVRGKARQYSAEFATAWRLYGRREEKDRAYAAWKVEAQILGSEEILLHKIRGALLWQTAGWAREGWKFAPYFERYLKRRKWEDERPPAPQTVPRHIDDGLSRSTDAKIEEYRRAASRAMTPEEFADVTRLNAKVSRG